MTADATEAALAVLGQYFSAPIARTLLTVTRRRESLEGVPLRDAALARAVEALERTLPSYLPDPDRRRDCAAALARLLSAADVRPAPKSDRSEPSSGKSPKSADRGDATSTRIYVASRPDHLQGAADVAREVAKSAGFGMVDQTKVATAVAELTRNMLQYAGGGELWLTPLEAPRRGVHIEAVDRGPGIPDLERVMSTTYRSRTGMGLGLKGVKRIVDEMDIQTSRAGTRVTLRKYLA